jgi:hypothetical protein
VACSRRKTSGIGVSTMWLTPMVTRLACWRPSNVDTGTDLPSFGAVKVGMVGRHRLVFVPLDRATVGPGYVKIAYDKKQVKDAPSIDTDGELPAEDEEAVFEHYGLTYQPGAGGERRLGRR